MNKYSEERKQLQGQVYIKYLGKKISLGYFSTDTEAAKEYDIFAREYFGEFARLNFEV